MTVKKFDCGPDGKIIAHPMTHFRIAVGAGTLCLLRLEYARSEEEFRSTEHPSLQLLLDYDQAAELAQSLARKVESIERSGKTGSRLQ